MEIELTKSSKRKSSGSSHSSLSNHHSPDGANIEQVEGLIDEASPAPVAPPISDLDIRYKIDDVPPWYLCIFLGFQHYLTMFGSTASIPLVLAPSLCLSQQSVGVSEILSTLFFVSGLVTIIQTTFGIRLPVIQGGTFSFLIPTFALLSLPKWKCPADPSPEGNNMTDNATSSWSAVTDRPLTEEELWKPRMLEVQGAIITASFVQVIVGATGVMGFVLKYIGPLTITPTIALIGMALFDVAADTCATQWGIALLTIAFIALFSQYLRNVDFPVFVLHRNNEKKISCRKTHYPIFKMFPIIMAIVLAWFLCLILTVSGAIKDDPDAIGYQARTDINIDVLYKAKWFRFPYPFQWGIPTFTLAGTLGMIAGVIAGMLESIGDYYACARLCGAPPPPTHAVNRGIMLEGIGCILSGMWGSGTGVTSYSENVGAIGITKVGSRRVIQTAGVIMIILGLFSKFGALFVTIPSPIVGGVFMVMFGVIAAVGISNLQYVDLNSSRNMFVFGVPILVGLSVPKWLKANPGTLDTGVDVLDQVITVLLSTSMFLGGTLAFILDNTVPGTPQERGVIQWTSQLVESGESIQADAAESKCYEVPFISKLIRKHSWTEYIPICPTFRGSFPCCKSTCCHKNRKRKLSIDAEQGSPQPNEKLS